MIEIKQLCKKGKVISLFFVKYKIFFNFETRDLL